MTNLDSVLKSRDITLLTNVCIVKAMIFPVATYGCESWMVKKGSAKELMPSSCGVGEDSWESLAVLRQQGDLTSQSWGKSTLNTHWKDRCWSWNSSIWVIWCKQLIHWKSPWCWQRLRAEGEEGVRGWEGWMASPMQWTWTWANFRRWWGTERPGMLQSMGSQRVRHDWRDLLCMHTSKVYTLGTRKTTHNTHTAKSGHS